MTVYNGTIANFLQGVSQQARRDRLPEQLESQVNCVPNITYGLQKRPGSEVKASITFPNFEDAAKHSYDRGDDTEKYTIIADANTLTAVDLSDGTPISVTGSKAYLANFASGSSLLAREYLKFFTIADTTFVVNTTAVPTMSNPSVEPAWQLLIYCKSALYGYTYVVKRNSVVIATYTTPSTIMLGIDTASGIQEASKAIGIKTSDIIQGLYAGGLSDWCTTNGYGITTDNSSSIIITHTSAVTDSWLVQDNNGNQNLIGIGKTVTKYDDLPNSCTDGYKVQVKNLDKTVDNAYYVKFERDDGAIGVGRGHWVECEGFGVNRTVTASLMPHKIVRSALGAFSIEPIAWVDRKAGDDDTNPIPSFIGHNISGIAMYQDRMTFISGENVVASQTFDHLNLFASSVISDSDDDPIDSSSSDNQVTNLEHILVFNSSLLLFSNKAQFVHPGEIPFISSKFSVASKTRYSTDVTSRPVASANSVFFPFNFGAFSGVREYVVNDQTGVTSADKITQHAQKYLPGKVLQMVSSTDYDILLCRVSGEPKSLYVYSWYTQDGIRKQSAWHKWEFSEDVLHVDIIQDTLYVWYPGHSGNFAYNTIDLSRRDTEDIGFTLCLDHVRKVTATSVGDTWVLTQDLGTFYTDTWDDVVVVGGLNTGIEGAEVAWVPEAGDTGVVIQKLSTPNYVGTPEFYMGQRFNAGIEITNPYVRSAGNVPQTKKRTTLRTMKFNCSDTGYLKFIVQKLYAGTYEQVFSSKLIGSPEYLLNSQAPLLDVEVEVPIHTDAAQCKILVSSNSHLPFNLVSADWDGSYTSTGRTTN